MTHSILFNLNDLLEDDWAIIENDWNTIMNMIRQGRAKEASFRRDDTIPWSSDKRK